MPKVRRDAGVPLGEKSWVMGQFVARERGVRNVLSRRSTVNLQVNYTNHPLSMYILAGLKLTELDDAFEFVQIWARFVYFRPPQTPHWRSLNINH